MTTDNSTPDVPGRFGQYGGQYVPATLLNALQGLDAAYVQARDDEQFQAELAGLLRDYVGRPSPLYLAADLSEANNLADKMPEAARRMQQDLARWRKDVGAQMPERKK